MKGTTPTKLWTPGNAVTAGNNEADYFSKEAAEEAIKPAT